MSVISYEVIITALTVAAGLSLLVERIVEFLKHVIESAGTNETGTVQLDLKVQANDAARLALDTLREFMSQADRTPDNLSAALRTALDKYPQAALTAPAEAVTESDHHDGDMTAGTQYENGSTVALQMLQPASAQDMVWLKLQLFYHLSALGFGVLIAHFMHIHLLSLLFLKGDMLMAQASDAKYLQLFFDEFFTGLVIAGGSQPIHMLLRFLTTRKIPDVEDTAADVSEEAQAIPEPAKAVATTAATGLAKSMPMMVMAAEAQPVMLDTAGWEAIDYRGGVNPEALANRNRRAGNPDLIVFHHTAMSSKLGFQAIVDEFLVNKGWSTGYHCVIMPDGAIKPFCRWDRVGNHAKGINNRSLGVAFHGNFHLDPNDKYSNADGHFGNQAPTPAQLAAGARLVALWAHLYDDIKLDFTTHILPHREAMPGHTVCPGDHFPIAEFKAQVTDFYQRWQNSAYAREQIQQFRSKPYLYI